ncbi:MULTISPECIES: Asp-tRNA(Asn)/Glu-tRNA(Gln) amidotransferase subunit GatC [Cetobacterium]|jgi:aspartyl-tRNA(Asn)/glutamyl-tRNA(Gln) amidotransferase subunit C|uniref:Aspartyl/glutamyl-tRNA(Asn/Gln) amidotransferase subunit C n=1 Tax=Candidatus Cetobacterium colombiensis TaxID=3073100 RepID=A0ABU4W8D5_9FUSO|nr:Asp-tRNA(Asn)/Glu-tRNA(Gln) amidotransferase subunit GatC [Candidatus Cetobacterium colombiensis]MDX8335773.1 Asp-tRNA(Asn)/Glu-tRNA(Gln) amidotransferase subunit GatC [Candidatus Cetobacterium colombiensis]
MSLTKEEVLNVAKLARLEFAEEEIARFQMDLNNILDYIDVLGEINTDEIEPLVQIHETGDKLREDVIRESLTVEEAMKNAPASEDGALIVPKVVGE